jgi:hypothetical protein
VSGDTYNGWANYPTWVVALWLGNQQRLYYDVVEIAERWNRRSRCEGGTVSGLADELHEYVGGLPEITAATDTASVAADLTGFALDQVAWQEIAGHYAAEVIGGTQSEVRAELENRRRVYVGDLRRA